MITLIILVLLVNLAFAAFCGAIARDRGHDRYTWMALGLFFGLVALVVLLLMPRGDSPSSGIGETPSPPSLPTTARIQCPTCGASPPTVKVVNGDRIYCATEDQVTGIFARARG